MASRRPIRRHFACEVSGTRLIFRIELHGLHGGHARAGEADLSGSSDRR